MIVTNKKTGKDVTKHVISYLKNDISKEQFEKLCEINNHKRDLSWN